jgi:NAD(P)-dependent dehydrogenase (short-subunit alcohol dehydrogenase family)
MMTSRPLDDKIALVTGASRGIGAAIARRLARDGARLVVHYGSGRDEVQTLAAELRDSGTQVQVVQADLALDDGGQRLVGELGLLALPRIDILVNNAGVAAFASTLERRPICRYACRWRRWLCWST